MVPLVYLLNFVFYSFLVSDYTLGVEVRGAFSVFVYNADALEL